MELYFIEFWVNPFYIPFTFKSAVLNLLCCSILAGQCVCCLLMETHNIANANPLSFISLFRSFHLWSTQGDFSASACVSLLKHSLLICSRKYNSYFVNMSTSPKAKTILPLVISVKTIQMLQKIYKYKRFNMLNSDQILIDWWALNVFFAFGRSQNGYFQSQFCANRLVVGFIIQTWVELIFSSKSLQESE